MKIAGRKSKVCCAISLFAVRIMGILGMLAIELWEDDWDSKVAASLRLEKIAADATSVVHDVRVVGGLVLFSSSFLISSALLIHACIWKAQLLSATWMLCETSGCVLQVTGLAYSMGCCDPVSEAWLLVVIVSCLVLTLYFWVPVVYSLFDWEEESHEEFVLSPMRLSSFLKAFENQGADNAVQIAKLPA